MDADFLEIDPDRLDRDWLRQASLAYKINLKLAEANYRLEQAKNAWKLVESDLTLAAHATPSEFNIEKTTEAVVKAAVTAHGDYQKAAAEANDAEREVGRLKAASVGISHKKSALENLVQLECINYRTEPRGKDSNRDYGHEAAKRAVAEKITPYQPKSKKKL